MHQDVKNGVQASEQLFRSIFENAQLGITFFNIDGRATMALLRSEIAENFSITDGGLVVRLLVRLEPGTGLSGLVAMRILP